MISHTYTNLQRFQGLTHFSTQITNSSMISATCGKRDAGLHYYDLTKRPMLSITICKCLISLGFFFGLWTYIKVKTWRNSTIISITWRLHSIFGRFWPVFDRLMISSGYRTNLLHKSLQFSFVAISMTCEINEKIDICLPSIMIGFWWFRGFGVQLHEIRAEFWSFLEGPISASWHSSTHNPMKSLTGEPTYPICW